MYWCIKIKKIKNEIILFYKQNKIRISNVTPLVTNQYWLYWGPIYQKYYQWNTKYSLNIGFMLEIYPTEYAYGRNISFTFKHGAKRCGTSIPPPDFHILLIFLNIVLKNIIKFILLKQFKQLNSNRRD